MDTTLTDPTAHGLALAVDLVRSPGPLRDGIERTIALLVEADAVWLLPAPAGAPGLVGDAVRTGLARIGRGPELGVLPVGVDAAAAVVPSPSDGRDVAVLLRADGRAFVAEELARVVATIDLAAVLRDRLRTPIQPESPDAERLTAALPWPRAVRLADGRSVFLRPADPGDQAGLLRLHARCSPTSVRRRFFSSLPRLRSRELLALLRNDGEAAAIVVADGTELLAVANLHLPRGDTSGEMAVLVEDAAQGQGLGTALSEAVAEIGAVAGCRRLHADVLAENVVMQRVLRRLGPATTGPPDCGSVTVTVELSGPPDTTVHEGGGRRDRSS